MFAGVAALAAGLAAAWGALIVLSERGDVLGAVSGRLAASAQGVLTAFGAASGAPLRVEVAGVPVALPVDSAHLVPALLLLLGPLTAAVTVGWLAAGASARQRLPVVLTVPVTALAFGIAVALAIGTIGRPGGGLIAYHVGIWPAFGLAFAGSAIVGGAVAAWRAAVVRRRPSMGPLRTRHKVRALVVSVLVGGSALVFAPAQGTPGAAGVVAYRRPGVEMALERLHAASPETWRVAYSPDRGVPSTVQLDVPLGSDVLTWLRTNSRLFGFRDVTTVLRQTLDGRDDLRRRHVWFQQVVGGIPVENAELGVQLDESGRRVQLLRNGLRPDLLPDRTPVARDAGAARRRAGKDLPKGVPTRETRLVMHPLDRARSGVEVVAVPVWSVALVDGDRGVSLEYLVAAAGPERIVQVRNQAMPVLRRYVYDLQHREWEYASGVLVRQESGPPSSIADANEVYDHSGETYQYFLRALAQDSFDGHGADMLAKVRWGEDVRNAEWSGGGAFGFTAFGDGFTKLDVVAHEWTHALTQMVFQRNTGGGGLTYEFESGALNESISDSFAERVESYTRGSNDWLMGAELKGGALRSMADPGKYKQPAHVRDYKEMCYWEDSGGVHSNSGIPNHAFYLIAQQQGISFAANLLWYTIAGGDFGMLASDSSFADFRIQQIAAAEALYGRNSPWSQTVEDAWSAVGVEDTTVLIHPDECTCAATTSLGTTGGGTGGGPLAQQLYLDLHRLLAVAGTDVSVSLRHYAEAFLAGSDRMSELMLANAALKNQFAAVLYAMQPVVNSLADDSSPQATVTAQNVAQVNALLDALAAADLAAGGHDLADLLAVERAQVDLDDLVGLDAAHARQFLDTAFGA
ncbi:M4 family metallopeptidase [Hamadaea sp. NPDC051192]|uniref:M4 family metallopeptidase n=1 Tax=Hamadaea sp. NPDC051192 TaxID=3154940 RepID=UPI003435E110